MDTYDENPYQAPAEAVEVMPVPGRPELAARLARLGAAILDALIGTVAAAPIMILTGYFARAMKQEVSPVEAILYSVLGFGIYMALHGYFLATRGQSIGKMALRIRIVDYNTGEILPLGKLVGLRLAPVWLVSLIPIIGGILALIDVLFIFGEERLCIHDRIAGTKVVVA